MADELRFKVAEADWRIDDVEDLSAELRAAWPALDGAEPRLGWKAGPTAAAAAPIALPRSVDWRLRGVVTPGPDQGGCNTCSSFAICGAIEALHQIQRRPAIRLAAGYIHTCQQGLACAQPADLGYAVDGVAAGGVAYGFPGDYPFPEDYCPTGNLYTIRRRQPLSGEASAKAALATVGPIVGEMWIYPDFAGFRGDGVYRHGHAGATQLHSVCVVGYDDDLEAWIIRNSFGPAWGRGDGTGYVGYGTGDLLTENRQAYQLLV